MDSSVKSTPTTRAGLGFNLQHARDFLAPESSCPAGWLSNPPEWHQRGGISKHLKCQTGLKDSKDTRAVIGPQRR
jgi:hypothetical protein